MRLFGWSILSAAIAVTLFACAPAASPAPAATNTSAPAATPTTAATTASGTVKVTRNAQLGNVLTDNSGRTLYLFTRDERNKSNCTGNCPQSWPALMATGDATAGEGVASNLLGELESTQVTYNGWPLYYYAQDTQASDAKGQNVGSIWFVVSADGGPILTNASIKTSQNALGTIVTDNSGRALYLFTRDEGGNSACNDNCPRNWPPVRTIGAPAAGEGATGSLLGTITRQDGSTQVTYGGKPLYYFATDEKPGDTKGQNVATSWYVVSAAGEAIRTAP